MLEKWEIYKGIIKINIGSLALLRFQILIIINNLCIKNTFIGFSMLPQPSTSTKTDFDLKDKTQKYFQLLALWSIGAQRELSLPH